jgi:signal transduction histidine kinase/CheY-like chemotaxis protein
VTAEGLEHRVLVLAPTGQDAANTNRILEQAGLPAFVCRSIDQLCREIEAGAGAILVTTEAFTADRERRLPQLLQRQPSWSDLPFVVLTRGGPDSPAGLQALASLGNAIALERPVRVSTLVAATRAALRQRAQQYKIRQQLETLAEHDQRKDEFLAMLAHELRNPLAPIKHGVQMIQRGAAEGERLHWITGVMDRQVSHLTRLVDDLLDVSRITRGKIHMEHAALPLQGVVAAALETVRPLVESRRQQLMVEAAADDYWVEGDHTRLTQVLANLLNNAAKYTPEGGRIWLSLARENGSVAMRVRDDGIGITPAVLPHVFDLFMQADSSLDRSQGGLGLGLTLVRRIVEMHQGSVRVVSEGPGHGAEFTVVLPLLQSGAAAEVESGPSGSAAECASSGCRVLVADDNIDLAQSIAMMLEYSGHQVRQVHTGGEAIAAAHTFQPQVCLLDIGLPDLSGHEVARRLRALPAGGEMLLIAVSGYAQDDQRRLAMASGFDHYLVKPVDFDQLEALLPMQKTAA